MFKFLAKLGVVAASAAVMVAASAPDAEAKKVRWKMHAAFGQNVAVLGPPPHRIADSVRRMSGGDFDIKVFEPGALAGGYAYFDPVSQGAFEAAFGTPGANQGKNSVFAFASTWPFGPAAPEFVAWFKYGGGQELVEKYYARDNIKYLLCGMIPPETSGWFREKITSLDQLKGLKMRFFGVGAKVMQKFGVATQQLAGGDIYPALELGTIDATEFSMPAIDRSYGFYQIAKFNYFPGWHQQSTSNELLINMDKWNELPDEYQAMLESACDANLIEMIADGEASQFAAMIANEKDGVENVSWSEENLETFRGAWNEVLAEELAANPDVVELWDSFTTFHEGFKVWGERGYLK
ncbi:TRAP transporter substrate-binding protein [Rhodobacteraceae bacterium NNCM2]|nr:TRAP transporter substrate-binding protein [Coraliihabitans acroporae]